MRRAIAIGLLWAGSAAADLNVPTPAGDGPTFCEFQVVNAENRKQPIGGFRYTLTLPDGHKKRGRVPKNGLVHVDVPHAGSCTIDFDLPPGMIVLDH